MIGSEKMNTQFVEEYIIAKREMNENKIIFSFYELRVKNNLTEDQVNEFLRLSKIRLENLDYQVYFTGEKYKYNEENVTVKDNELMVAVKE